MNNLILQHLADSDDQDDSDLKVLSLMHDSVRDFIKLLPGHLSLDGSAVMGKNGYIFVHDGSNSWHDQVNGVFLPGDYLVNKFNNNIDKYREKYQNSFSLLVIPEKDIIYPSENVLISQISNERFISKVKLNSNDLYAENILKNTNLRVFHKRNSHYNVLGGYLVFHELMKILGYSIENYLDKIKIKQASWPDDLSIKFSDYLITKRNILDVTSKEILEANPGGLHSHAGKKIRLINDDFVFDEKIIVFGDSYSWNPDAGLIRFLSIYFKEIFFQWGGVVDHSLINEFRPDRIVLQIAERFLPNCQYSKEI